MGGPCSLRTAHQPEVYLRPRTQLFTFAGGETACSSLTLSFESLQERMTLKQTFCPIPTNMLFPDDEDVVVHLVHSPLNDIVSLYNLEVASSPRVPSEPQSHSRVKRELSCWLQASIASGHDAVIPDWNTLGCILQMTYQGHLGIKCCSL